MSPLLSVSAKEDKRLIKENDLTLLIKSKKWVKSCVPLLTRDGPTCHREASFPTLGNKKVAQGG